MRSFFWAWLGFWVILLFCSILFIRIPEIKRAERCFDQFTIVTKERMVVKDLIRVMNHLDRQCERYIMSGCAYIAIENEFGGLDFACKMSFL